MKVYPIGYSAPGTRATIDALLQADERTMLVDVRYSVSSKRKPDWSGTALKERYGSRYLWLQDLGNVNYYNGGPITLCRPERGISRIVALLCKGYNLILLCTCPEYDSCHRKVIVDTLLEMCPDVQVEQPQATAPPDSIMCLSIRQPYAHWLSNPQLFIDKKLKPKTIENRDWTTKYRGPLLLHASMTFEEDALDYWCGRVGYGFTQVVPMLKQGYKRGAIVGYAELVNVVTESDDPWFVGRYGFVLANARPIEPIPYRGQLKLFSVEKAIVEGVLV